MLKMSPGFKSVYNFPGTVKILLVIFIMCSYDWIRPNCANRISGDYPHEMVKRQALSADQARAARAWGAAPKHEYPFAVLLKEEFGLQGAILCHGVLVAPHIVLTMAQEVCRRLKPEKAMVMAGMHDASKFEDTLQAREVCHVDIHAEASGFKKSYMVLYLSDPFTLNDYVRTISLPLPNAPTPKECMFPTWQNGSGIVAQHTNLTIKTCKNADPSFICTLGGPCIDPGSPLVCAEGNREFVAGVFINSDCGGGADVYFSSFMNKAFGDWFKGKVKAVPKLCYQKHG